MENATGAQGCSQVLSTARPAPSAAAGDADGGAPGDTPQRARRSPRPAAGLPRPGRAGCIQPLPRRFFEPLPSAAGPEGYGVCGVTTGGAGDSDPTPKLKQRGFCMPGNSQGLVWFQAMAVIAPQSPSAAPVLASPGNAAGGSLAVPEGPPARTGAAGRGRSCIPLLHAGLAAAPRAQCQH